MTNTKHTPAPWLITNAHIEHDEWVIGIASEKQDGTLALVIGSKARPGYGQESIEATLNACLIAAAPELLEALKRARELFYTFGDKDTQESRDCFTLFEVCDAAIQKATGGE